jgi:hypothetical protein
MLVLLLALAADPLALESLTPLDARNLKGKAVTVSFVVGRPTFSIGLARRGPSSITMQGEIASWCGSQPRGQTRAFDSGRNVS